MMQHFHDEEQVAEGPQALSPAEWMEDIDDLNCHYNRSMTPPTSSALRATPPDDTLLFTIYRAAEPMFATASAKANSIKAVAQQILGAAVKAGYLTLMKHYNRIVSVGVLACALDPRFNLAYYEQMGHGRHIVESYIPLYVLHYLSSILLRLTIY